MRKQTGKGHFAPCIGCLFIRRCLILKMSALLQAQHEVAPLLVEAEARLECSTSDFTVKELQEHKLR